MSRRKLSNQQQRQVAAKQAEQLEQDGEQRSGLVVGQYAKRYAVAEPGGEVVDCCVRQNLGVVVIGDEVVWQQDEQEQAVIVAVKPRTSVLTRPGFKNREKVVAANVDIGLIVIAVKPQLSEKLIDKYLAGILHSTLKPVLLLNKVDLTDPTERESLEALAQYYRKLNLDVLLMSLKTEEGVADLKARLQKKTAVLLGQSGAGKSSLINRLVPGSNVKVQEVSVASGLGQHTTTSAHLYCLSNGGKVMDLPGFRDFNLNNIPQETLATLFEEFAPFAKLCRFRNCRHHQEPDCAVRQAVEQGKIRTSRWGSYMSLLSS